MTTKYAKTKATQKRMADGGSVKEKVLGLFGIKKPEGYDKLMAEGDARRAEQQKPRESEKKAPATDASIGGAINAINARKKALDDI